jgi:predicted acetyltransferase
MPAEAHEMSISLLIPTAEELASYADALKRGWSPDNLRGKAAADEQLKLIECDPARFLSAFDDPEGKGPPVTLPDGSVVQRLPGIKRLIWDGEFCGTIGFRWQQGTSELPSYVLGHIGYAVVEWKRGRGCATQALKLLLPEAKRRGLPYVELTTDPDNIPSQKVITGNGGYLVERFTKTAAYGGNESLRWRIDL